MQLFDGHVENPALKVGNQIVLVGVAVRGETLAASPSDRNSRALPTSCFFETAWCRCGLLD